MKINRIGNPSEGTRAENLTQVNMYHYYSYLCVETTHTELGAFIIKTTTIILVIRDNYYLYNCVG